MSVRAHRIGPNSSRAEVLRLGLVAVVAITVLSGFKAAGAGGSHRASTCGRTPAAKVPLRYAGFLRGDIDGDGRRDRVWIVRTSKRPAACRFAVVVRTDRGVFVAPIHTLMLDRDPRLDMIRELEVPKLYALATVDRRPGAEVVVDVDRGASSLTLAVFAIRGRALQRVHAPVSVFFFNATVRYATGLDCTRGAERGDFVVGSASAGFSGRRWVGSRTFYAVRGDGIRRLATRSFRLSTRRPYHPPYLRFHEFGGDAFHSCTVARNPEAR